MTVANFLLGVTVVAAIGGMLYKNWPVPSNVKLKLNSSYDYIIVGGGTAGCVLASRLTEDPAVRVLLLEAGGEETAVWIAEMPLAALELQRTGFDWQYMTQPQKQASGAFQDKQIRYPSGKVLGGSSSLNFMVYSRGSKHDYNAWADAGCKGWSYFDIINYFIKAEDQKSPMYSSSGFHGYQGPMTINDFRSTVLGETFVKAGVEMGHTQVDINSEKQLGVSVSQATMSFGRRVSTAKAYLRLTVNRKNLHVATNAHVTKVIIENNKAIGVEFVRNNTRQRIVAKREVILSAGTFGSAKILQLSGIGPKEHLDELNIPVIADLPVGNNLQDHVWVVGLEYWLRSKVSITEKKAKGFWSLMDFLLFGQGYLASTAYEGIGFFKSLNQPQNESYPYLQMHLLASLCGSQTSKDKRNSVKLWNYENNIFESLHSGQTNRDGLTFMPILLHSQSRGTVRLASTDPFDPPLIDPNYLADQRDVDVLLEGVRLVQRFAETKPFQRLGTQSTNRVHPNCRDYSYNSDPYWHCYIRQNTNSMYHAVGTCKMGARTDPTTVVDPQLRVHGIMSLRVVDASIMPVITSGNTAAATVMIAEKAADIIRNKVTVPKWGQQWPKKKTHPGNKDHDEL